MTTTEPTTTEAEVIDVSGALGRLAMRAVQELGTGYIDDEGEADGQLDGRVYVRFASVLGEKGYAVTMESADATIWIDTNLAAIEQLQALLEALVAHCISPYTLLR